MKRLFSLVSIFFLIGFSIGTAHAEDGPASWFDRMVAAHEDAFDEKCDPAYEILKQGVKDPEFETDLSVDGRAALHRGIIRCAGLLKDKERARQGFDDWRTLGIEEDLAWSYEWEIYEEKEWGEPLTALDTLEVWLAGGEALRRKLEVQTIIYIRESMLETFDGKEQARAIVKLYDLLDEYAFVYLEPEYDPSQDYLLKARSYMELGDIEAAKKQVELITDPSTLISLYTLNRYAPLRDPGFDMSERGLLALFETDLQTAAQRVTDNPEYLGLRVRHANALRRLGRSDEAIDVLETAVSIYDQTPSFFVDADKQIHWVYDFIGSTQFSLGEVNRGVNTYRKAITARERGSQNVSQVINLAISLTREARFTEAKAVLSVVGKSSDYGLMFEKYVMACAAHQLGNDQTASEHLDFLVTNRDDNEDALMMTFLCMDMEDDAVAVKIERLEDPDQAGWALRLMHRTNPNPHISQYNRVLYERAKDLNARDDVQAAAAKVGQIIDIPVYETFLSRL